MRVSKSVTTSKLNIGYIAKHGAIIECTLNTHWNVAKHAAILI